jgi:hypothetical protein
MAGLVPAIHVFVSKKQGVDARDTPGHDERIVFGTVPALRSGMKNAAPRPGHESAGPALQPQNTLSTGNPSAIEPAYCACGPDCSG